MNDTYSTLAGAYDALTQDVGYKKRADYLEKLFQRSKIPVHTVLDLACGTGTMTWLLASRGYEMIGVDASAEDFVKTAKEQDCRLIACSSLLTTSMNEMARVVELCKAEGIREQVTIMVGGAPITQEFCDRIGADCCTPDAASCARKAVELLA